MSILNLLPPNGEPAASTLTPLESKAFEVRLAEYKKRHTGISNRVLTQHAEKIRADIIAKRHGRETASKGSAVSRAVQQLVFPNIIPIIAAPHIAPLSNWIAKSAIFAPRAPRTRKDTGAKWVELPSPRGVTILYNGPELDMADHTLYLHLIKMAEGRGPNETIIVNRGKLLRACGYPKLGSASYKWLQDAFDRLLQANIKICIDNSVVDLKEDTVGIFSTDVNTIEVIDGTRRVNITLKIMGEFAEVPETGDYFFSLPPTSLALFANLHYGHNDLLKRNIINQGRRADLAAWLQSYICSEHSGEHAPVLVKTLWQHSASGSRLNDFSARLRVAMDTLHKAEVVTQWNLYVNADKQAMLAWTR
jgi:hypothetical protein